MLSLIGMSGECSGEALSLLLPQESYKKRVIKKLMMDNLITKRQKDGVVGYRLMYNSKKYLLQTSEDSLSFYLAEGADFSMRKSTPTQRMRQHRISETIVMMEKAGIVLDRAIKPPLFEEKPLQTDEYSQSFFYHPKEVKAQSDLTRKIISSRMTGVWLTPSAVWLCYNIGSQLPNWFENVEDRAEALIRSMLREKDIPFDDAGALLFGRSMEWAKECLNDPKTVRYILNSSFNQFCYVPLNEKGILYLQLLNKNDAFTCLQSILAEDLQADSRDRWISHDGYNPDGLPTLVCIDCDLKRLIRFITQLRYQGLKGEVICFDFQKEGIQEYCEEKAKISTVDLETVRRKFLSRT